MNRTALRPLRTRRLAGEVAAPRRATSRAAAAPAPAPLLTRRRLAVTGLAWFLGSMAAHAAPTAGPTAPEREALLQRGSYLVESVGLCADCHTPRTEKGALDRSRWLLGAALPFSPTVPMPWAPAAPPIAGLPAMTAAQDVEFLRTGKRPDGSMPRPPMPEFRFNAEDATAIVAYLKSLAP
jgi:mono/diheme cytochrome c family protein